MSFELTFNHCGEHRKFTSEGHGLINNAPCKHCKQQTSFFTWECRSCNKLCGYMKQTTGVMFTIQEIWENKCHYCGSLYSGPIFAQEEYREWRRKTFPAKRKINCINSFLLLFNKKEKIYDRTQNCTSCGLNTIWIFCSSETTYHQCASCGLEIYRKEL